MAGKTLGLMATPRDQLPERWQIVSHFTDRYGIAAAALVISWLMFYLLSNAWVTGVIEDMKGNRAISEKRLGELVEAQNRTADAVDDLRRVIEYISDFRQDRPSPGSR